ncbi:lipid IV(A) 3-deoxy-D-manno-octulosonic acid transferase [Porticoccus sp.]
MARLVYSLLFYLLTPLILLRLLWRSRLAPEYRRRWGERFGFVTDIPSVRQVIWVHSVSVGETLAAVPMIRELQRRYPHALLAVTTMTPTGSARVKAVFGDSVYHVYAPYDLPCVLRRFLKRLHPDLLVIMETELWPNLIHCCQEQQIPVVVANARLSANSAKGYRKFAALTSPMLGCINTIAAQHQADGERFLSLGLSAQQLVVTGNIKFDLDIDDELKQRAAELRSQWRGTSGRPVLLAASTHRGEDDIVLDAFARLLEHYPHLLLVLVPRHPERFDEVARLCEARKLQVVRRSGGVVPDCGDQVLLGDTMGELLLFFGACDIAFVGGSLVPVGGHNLIEPAAWQVPVLSGPQLFNFVEASRLLLQADGMAICEDATTIAAKVAELLASPETAARMGAAAKSVADNNRGALERLLAVIERQLLPR